MIKVSSHKSEPAATSGNTLTVVVPDTAMEIRLDVGSLIRDVRNILESADEDQAALTERYIEAGRRLWQINDGCKKRKESLDDLLEREFPGRRSTLREYMTLARDFDAADEATKVQLTGLFKHGWGAVLGELRRLKRVKRSQNKNGSPAKGDAGDDNLRILLGDCMVRLRELPNDSVDCVITSVPYYRRLIFPDATTVFGGDRQCIHDWETRRLIRRNVDSSNIIESGTCRKCGAQLVMLGWEDTLAEYVRHVVEVFDEVKRVLKPTGVIWINIADTYLDKELLLVPHRLAIALADNGWITGQEVIWHVTGRAPENVTDRLYCNHEHLLVIAKRKDHYFDAAAIRERAFSTQHKRLWRHLKFKGTAATWHRPPSGFGVDGLRNPRTVWSIPNERVAGDHHCPFPKALVERMLLSSCPEGGVCLDPFGGTGTTALVALAHGRKAILIEANADYCGIAKHRIETEIGPYKAELGKSLKAGSADRHPNSSSLRHAAHYPGRPADLGTEPDAEIRIRHAEDDHPDGE